MRKYYELIDALQLIDPPNREACLKLLYENKELFSKAKGSNTKHQAWQDGYLDHILETMNLAILLYESLSSTGRKLNFSLSDALLVMFIHDLEKPYKQVLGKELKLSGSQGKNTESIKDFKEYLLKQYGITLNSAQLNGLKYVEGENEDYHPTERIMNELATFCHICDMASARIWHDQPKERGKW